MTRFLTVLVLMCTAILCRAASPGDVVDRMATVVNGSPSVTVDFVIVDGAGNDLPSTLIVSKDKFRLSSQGIETWYDGKTQWTYFSEPGQLTLTEPTAEELLENNPLAILGSWKKLYTATSTGRPDEVSLDALQRTAAVKNVRLTADASTSMPQKMLITFSNGQQATVLVKNIRKGKAVPASTFVYDSKRFPAKETVDLR